MITAQQIETALGLTSVELIVRPGGKASIIAAETVTAAMQAQVQRWVDAGEVSTRELSKLTLAERLAALGKLPAFIAVLDAEGGILRFMWDSAQSLSTAHPLFNEHAPAIKAALDLTDAQFDALLAP
jgi:hypothetical protein